MYYGKKKGWGHMELELFKVPTPWDFHKSKTVVPDLIPFHPYYALKGKTVHLANKFSPLKSLIHM